MNEEPGKGGPVLVALNAKFIHTAMAVYSLQAYAAAKGIDIPVCEFTINQPQDLMIKELYRMHPCVAAFSIYIWNASETWSLIRAFHELLPETEIWVGGPEVTYQAEKVLLEHPEVTGLMRGEGEETFLELCRLWKNDREIREGLKRIKGITFRTEAGIFAAPTRELLKMDSIPFPYRNLELLSGRILYYESSRGCPFSCVYCLSSVEKTVRFKQTDRVKQELKRFLDADVKQVKFVDRTFNCNRSHTMEIWKYLLEHDNGITNFHFEISGDLLGDEEIALLAQARPGYFQFEIGVQSTNPETLKQIRRQTDLMKLAENIRKLRQAKNIHLHLDLIAGLPEEDYERFALSFNEVYRMQPSQLQLGFLKVLSGSEMFQMISQCHVRHKIDPPYEVLSTRWLSYDDLIRLIE